MGWITTSTRNRNLVEEWNDGVAWMGTTEHTLFTLDVSSVSCCVSVHPQVYEYVVILTSVDHSYQLDQLWWQYFTWKMLHATVAQCSTVGKKLPTVDMDNNVRICWDFVEESLEVVFSSSINSSNNLKCIPLIHSCRLSFIVIAFACDTVHFKLITVIVLCIMPSRHGCVRVHFLM